jgi:hypothetical protein
VIAVFLLALGQAAPGFAKQKAGSPAATKAGSEMNTYLVISPHTPENCLATLDAIKAGTSGTEELARWEWGCMSGDHTGYMMVTAPSPGDALKHVPEAERGQAKVIALNKFTAEQIRTFHEAKK